ncbi:MAG: MATE family efflux transporter [Flavobacteriales bacterium]|nr:MATE family efflux transporter [Flavobacteriales bacterium]
MIVEKEIAKSENSTKLDISIRNMLLVAVPVCVGPLVSFILVLTDNIYASRLGINAMNGVATVGLVYITFVILGVGLGSGAQILIARRNGERNFQRAGITAANSFFIGLVLAVLIFITLRFVCPLFFRNWVESEEIRAVMDEFLRIRAWGALFYVPAVILGGFFIGIAQTKIVGITMGTSAVLNVVIGWILVFGKFGIEPMGVEGAAYATIISEFVSLFLILIYTFNSRHGKEYQLRSAFSSVPLHESVSILRLSGPLMLQLLLSLAIWTIFFFFIEKLGEKEMQASHIIRNCYLLALIAVMGFSQTTRTFISTLLAEKRAGEIPLVQKRLILLNFCGILVLGHGLILYPDFISSLFDADAEVMIYARNSMLVVFPAMLLFSVSSILLNTVEGSGNTLAGFLIELATTLFYFSFAYAVTIAWPQPVHFAWMADWIYFSCIGLFSWLYLRNGNWKYKEI